MSGPTLFVTYSAVLDESTDSKWINLNFRTSRQLSNESLVSCNKRVGAADCHLI